VENSKGEEILPGATTVDTSIKLEGKGAKGQKVLIKDGNIEIGTADINPQSGDWEFPVTGLSADTHSFTATAMYGSGQVSDPPRIVVVVAADTPAITSVKDESNWNIRENGYTVHTSVTLTGSAPDGQEVEVFLGAVSKGKAKAGSNSIWTRTVSGLSLDVLHTFKAIGQYANNPPSNTWRLTVLNGVVPAITGAEDSKGQPISNDGSTVDTTVRLRGTATKYLEVEIFDGNSSTGKKALANENGIWTVELTGLTRTKHVFKAKALYGSGTESGEWAVNVVAAAAPTITSVQDESKWNIPDNGYTVHTSIALEGSAPAGEEVEVFLGAVSKGKAKAESNSIWTRTVSGLSLDVLHTFKTIGQYANNPPSNPWRLTVLNGVQPAITGAEDSKGQPISNDGSTGDTTVRLRGTANKYLEVEIFDGNSSTGKKALANENGIWTVELTGLTRTKHVFKAKALYGSGTESGEWIVNVVDLVDLVEDFQSYPQYVHLRNPGESIEGTNTKVTLNATLGGARPDHSVLVPPESRLVLRACSSTRTSENILAYSLALKQGRAKSAIISGLYIGFVRGHIKLELLQGDELVESTVLFEGNGNGGYLPIDKEIAPLNGQAFDTLKFEFKAMTFDDHVTWFDIKTVTFKS
jgi:hypothetical protein